MTTQEITLNQSSDAGLYTKLLRGRYVTSIDDGTITHRRWHGTLHSR